MHSIADIYSVFKINPVVSTDSRNIIPGSVFFALKGPSFNGNKFADSALEKGAEYSVIDEAEYKKSSRHILVDDVLKTLQDLANFHRKKLDIPFLAVTGSNGKTTTKELIRNVLSKKFKTIATKGNLNNHIGVPLTLLSIPSDAEFAVIEMGANHQKEIESYCKIAEPDYGIITNVGKAHLEGFGGFEGVKIGKGELYQWISRMGKGIFINGDNRHLEEMAGRMIFNEVIEYGESEKYYCCGELISEQPLIIQWKCKGNSGTVSSHLQGSYNFENILSAICIGNYFGVSAEEIKIAIEEYMPDNSRSQLIRRGSNTIILDAYNANPTSMEAALKNFSGIAASKKIVFIGDMAELGEESPAEHKRISELLSESDYQKIFLVGKNFSKFSSVKSGIYFDDSEKAKLWLKENPINDAYILIKGSRSTQMEKILEAL